MVHRVRQRVCFCGDSASAIGTGKCNAILLPQGEGNGSAEDKG